MIVIVPSFIADILRKFDNMVEVILPQLPTSFSSISDPEGKSALIWILGEYGEVRGKGKGRGRGRGESRGGKRKERGEKGRERGREKGGRQYDRKGGNGRKGSSDAIRDYCVAIHTTVRPL